MSTQRVFPYSRLRVSCHSASISAKVISFGRRSIVASREVQRHEDPTCADRSCQLKRALPNKDRRWSRCRPCLLGVSLLTLPPEVLLPAILVDPNVGIAPDDLELPAALPAHDVPILRPCDLVRLLDVRR